MAATKIIPIRSTIEKSVAYICNPHKTDESLLIHSEHCFPQTAALVFQHHLSRCRAGGNTVGRHLIQSFAPGEVDPVTAHEIGKKLADEILKGEYAYVMATHVDRGHVHNHFIWGAANIATHRRYRSNKNTYHEIRKISDRLCEENSLSVIIPQGVGKSFTEYNAAKQGTSWKAKLKAAIDNTTSESADFEDFIKRMELQGYKIKRGKHIAFCEPEQERFTRAKSLGMQYTEDAIRAKIANLYKSKTITAPTGQKSSRGIIDIDGNEKIKSSPGLKQWAKIQNFKNTVQAFNLMQEYGGREAFVDLMTECRHEVERLENALEATDDRIKYHSAWREVFHDYYSTRTIYTQYRDMAKSKNNVTFFGKNRAEEFRKEHEDDILTHETAKKELENQKRPLPKIQDIDSAIAKLKANYADTIKLCKAKRAEFQQFKQIHNYLFDLDVKFNPKHEPQQQPKRTKNYDVSL